MHLCIIQSLVSAFCFIWTQFFLLTTAPCLSQIVLKFGLHRSTPSSEILPQSDPPTSVDMSVGLMENYGRIVRDMSQWSQWRAYRKPPSLFRVVPSLTPYELPFPKMGSQMRTRTPRSTSRRMLPRDEYGRRYRQGISVLCRMSL